VTNPEVGVVLVTGDDEDNRDRQVMVSHIRQPQLGLGMETTQEGENRTTRTLTLPNTC